MVGVVGEPGVGKSRLFFEFIHSHRTQGWLIIESGSVSYGKATAYLPVIDLLKGYFDILDRDDARKIREKVTGKLLTLDKALESTLPAVLSLLDLPVEDAAWETSDPPQRRQRTLEAIKRLLLRESQAQPLLLVFEDLHWIDSETQSLLDSLIETLPTARLLLLVNYRPEYQHAWGNKTYYTQLRVDPLPAENADEFLTALLGDHAALQPLKRILLDRTEGNAFFYRRKCQSACRNKILSGRARELIGWKKHWKAHRCRRRCKRCWLLGSIDFRRKRSGFSSPPPLLERIFPLCCSKASRISLQKNFAGASVGFRPRSSSTRPVGFLISNTLSNMR